MKYSDLSKLEREAVDWLTTTNSWSWWWPLTLLSVAVWSWWTHWSDGSSFPMLFSFLAVASLVSWLRSVGVRRLLARCDIEIDPPKSLAARRLLPPPL